MTVLYPMTRYPFRWFAINEIQEGLLEIMTDVDRAFRECGVEYSLAYGTVLGAVRHGGFIPWDDDIDIVILDTDEDKLDMIMEHLPEGKYFLQRPLTVDWANSFYKLKLNGSTAIEESHLGTRMHQGLFIDIFVARRCPNPGIRRKLFFLLEYMQRGFRLMCFRNYGRPRRDWWQGILYWFYRRDLGMRRRLCKKKDAYVHMDEPTGAKEVFERSLMESMTDIGFEGRTFRVVSDYEGYLTRVYGDYMQLPPEEQRVGKHLIAYDRNLDYRDWLAEHYKDGKRTGLE